MKVVCVLLCSGKDGRCRRVCASVSPLGDGRYAIYPADHSRGPDSEALRRTYLDGRTGPIPQSYEGTVEVPKCHQHRHETTGVMVVPWPKVWRKIQSRRVDGPPARYLPPTM